MMDAEKRISIERLREQWQRQLMADPEIQLSYLKVAIAIGFHLNRTKGGWAWPGINRIATIARVHPRTVIRATAWLSDRGHMRVVRTRKGKRNLSNRYLPTLRQANAGRSGATVMSLGSGKAMSLGGGLAMSPKPLTEPLTEHPIPIILSASTSVDELADNDQIENEGSGIRERKESGAAERPAATRERLKSAKAECYRLAGKYDGDRGRALVTKALEEGTEQDVLDAIGEAFNVGDDLGCALSDFWKHL